MFLNNYNEINKQKLNPPLIWWIYQQKKYLKYKLRMLKVNDVDVIKILTGSEEIVRNSLTTLFKVKELEDMT